MNRQCDGSLPVPLIHDFRDMFQRFLTCLENGRAVIAYNVIEHRVVHVSFHVRQMEEALVSFRIAGRLSRRQHGIDLHAHESGINHGISGISRMNTDTADFKLCTGGVKIFINDFRLDAPVHGISEIRAELLKIQIPGTAADFFIRCKGNADFSVRTGILSPPLQERLRCRHDLRDASLIVGAEQGVSVRSDQRASFHGL